MSKTFQKCEHGERVSQCYHVPRCGHVLPGNRLTEFGRWVQVLTYTVSVTVPDGTDAGEPATAMAEALDIVRCTRPEWAVGDFELSAVDGEQL